MEIQYEDIKRIVRRTLIWLCQEHRGDHFITNPKRIAKLAHLSTKPLTLTLVRYAIDEIAKEGLTLPNGEHISISVWSNDSHGIKYIISFPDRAKNKELLEEVVGVIV